MATDVSDIAAYENWKIAKEQLAMQKDVFNQQKPIRDKLFSQYGDILSGKFDPSADPMFSPAFAIGKKGIEDQYKIAKDNILAGTARGGGQISALGDLEGVRAEQSASLPAMLSEKIIGDITNRATGSVFPGGDTSGAMGLLGNTTNLLNNNAMQRKVQESQERSSTMQGIGSLIGLIIGAYTGGAGYALMGAAGGGMAGGLFGGGGD